MTLTLTGLVDAPLTVEFEDDEAVDSGLVGNFQTGALVQLRNRWRVSLSYFGQYASDEAFSSRPDRKYVDNVALSVGSAWGTVAGGNVSGVVREQTRRRRGAGNAALEFDDALGGLDEWGSGYTVRLGPLARRRGRRRERRLSTGRGLSTADRQHGLPVHAARGPGRPRPA